MTYSCTITDIKEPLVIDTSVLINLRKCTYGKLIVSALPNKIVIPQFVLDEFISGKGVAEENNVFFRDLQEVSQVSVVKLTSHENAIFEELTINSPKTLGDGEASVIAVSVNRNLFPVIDDKRGRRHSMELNSGQEPGWSLDIFRHPAVLKSIGNNSSKQALFLALTNAKMHIARENLNYVYNIIGKESAKLCPSLPLYEGHQDTPTGLQISELVKGLNASKMKN